jgi:hypothetical protein
MFERHGIAARDNAHERASDQDAEGMAANLLSLLFVLGSESITISPAPSSFLRRRISVLHPESSPSLAKLYVSGVKQRV